MTDIPSAFSTINAGFAFPQASTDADLEAAAPPSRAAEWAETVATLMLTTMAVVVVSSLAVLLGLA
ncbi:MAG: hypothetical protein JWN71_3500 [Xanthobacteraceae bacterium]|nr:hypothetical protein [Xanthobacteraceae bacterium]